MLNADGDMSGFASYDDAFAAAKGYLAAKIAAAKAAVKPAVPTYEEFWADVPTDASEEAKRSVYNIERSVLLSPFNPAAYDAEMTEDFVACLRGDAERMSLPEPGYGNKFCDNGNGSGVV